MTSRKIAIVTASTAGIGLAIAKALAADGYHVIVSSRNPDHVNATVSLIRSSHGEDSCSGIACHVGKESDRLALLQHAQEKGSHVHALILNAAVSTVFGRILDSTESDWDKIFDINLKAAFLIVKLFAHTLVRGSSIVLTTSIAAYSTMPGLGIYSISKTALLGMCKVLAGEFARKGIRVNAVAPGLIQTKFSEKLWKKEGSTKESDKQTDERKLERYFRIPLGRIGQPEDISGLVTFLVSDKASYITGETIVAAGGLTSKL